MTGSVRLTDMADQRRTSGASQRSDRANPDRTSRIRRPARPASAAERGRSRLGDATRPIVRERRLARSRRGTVLFFLLGVGTVGVLAATVFVLPFRTYVAQDDQIDDRSDQLAEINAVVDDLRSEVARLRTDEGIREAARAELGFVQAGEQRQTVLPANGVPTDLPEGWPYDLVENIVDLRRTTP